MAHDPHARNPSHNQTIQVLLEKYGSALLPLTAGPGMPSLDAKQLQQTPAAQLFPHAPHPEASVSGLLLLLQQWNASHSVSQDIDSPEGSYWHGIAHRIEPDSFNAAYWFRRVGSHPIFPTLNDQAAAILSAYPQLDCRMRAKWDPLLFIEWCDRARKQTGSPLEKAMLAVQKAEWQLLFNWCSQAAD